jgi:hypothetical protein
MSSVARMAMANTDFLSFLVDETLKLQHRGEVSLSSFEHKINDYKLSFLKGEFIPQSQVLRFKTSFGPLDIPINWSVFAIDNEQGAILDPKNDEDHFFEVIRLAWDKSFEKLLITHADGFCYLVGLKAGEETYLHDLLNPQEWLKTA